MSEGDVLPAGLQWNSRLTTESISRTSAATSASRAGEFVCEALDQITAFGGGPVSTGSGILGIGLGGDPPIAAHAFRVAAEGG